MDVNRRQEVGAMHLRKKKSLMDQAREQASDLAADWNDVVRPQLESAVSSAKATAIPLIADAREKAAPVLADARDRAVAGLSDAREKAGPIYASGAALAGEKAIVARDLANAKVAQLKGEPAPKKRRSKLKEIAFFAIVAGAVGFVARKLQGGQAADNWQSSYVPSPAPSAAPQPVVDDVGGSAPDEALADEHESPQPVTTPDDPAEVVELDQKEK
jgi:hypothetical protein